MMWLIAAGVLGGLYGLHRLALWMEAQGWIYYMRKKASGNALGSAVLSVQQIIQPGAEHVMEVRQETRRHGDAGTRGRGDRARLSVPDEPLDLPPNQALIVQIERVGGEAAPAGESVLTWLAANAVDSEALPTDLADRHDHYLYGRTSTVNGGAGAVASVPDY